ncbi:hypothetical protein ISCGN_001568 [Ixodes scapularis]
MLLFDVVISPPRTVHRRRSSTGLALNWVCTRRKWMHLAKFPSIQLCNREEAEVTKAEASACSKVCFSYSSRGGGFKSSQSSVQPPAVEPEHHSQRHKLRALDAISSATALLHQQNNPTSGYSFSKCVVLTYVKMLSSDWF